MHIKLCKFEIETIYILCCVCTVSALVLVGDNYKISNTNFNQSGKVAHTASCNTYKVSSLLGSTLGNIVTKNDAFVMVNKEPETPGTSGRIAAETLEKTHVYPNPCNAALGHTFLTFTQLTSRAEIHIYSISGMLVRSLYKDDAATDEMRWDLTNDNGETVASGVYLYYIKSGTLVKKGKIIIIR